MTKLPQSQIDEEEPQPNIRVTVFLPADVDRRLEIAAAERGITKSRLVAEAIILYAGQK